VGNSLRAGCGYHHFDDFDEQEKKLSHC
jgi:hypothetical protein